MSDLTNRECGGACGEKLDFDFTMAFQPVVNVPEKSIYAHEALVRGLNGESAGSILSRVTGENRYAFDQACRTTAIRMACELNLDCRLNINFLPNAVYHPEACLQITLKTAAQYGFPLDRITFEFTEDERVMDRQHLRNIVETYRRFGIHTALDDFGAGYAGLSLLADFQPDVIKIDRVLLTNIHADPVRQAVVKGIVQTCQMLNIDVVAEGVEEKEELGVLLEMGIRLFQGYLFARPRLAGLVAVEDIEFPVDAVVK